MPRILRLLALVCLLAACGEPTQPSGDVRLTVAPEELPSGDPLVAKVENRSREQVTLDFCYVVVQLRTPSGWRPDDPQADDHPGGLCAAVGHVLMPGGTHQQVAPIRHALDPGDYRLWLHVEMGATDTMIVSQEFHVRG